MFLYDAESIRTKIQSVLRKTQGRRFAIVAFVGQDALDFVREPKELTVYCWDNPIATNPDGVKALIAAGATVYFVDRLHIKLFWSQAGGAIVGSCNLTRNALGDSSTALKEAAYFCADSSIVPIDDVLSTMKPKTLVTDSVLSEFRRRYTKAAALRDEDATRALAAPLPGFAQYLKHPNDQSWSTTCWSEKGNFESARLAAVREYSDTRGFSRDPLSFIHDCIFCYVKPKVGDWILCCKVGKNRDLGRLAWLYTHLVAKPRKNSVGWDAIHLRSRVDSPPFDCDDEIFKAAFKAYAAEAELTEKATLSMTPSRVTRLGEFFHQARVES